MSMSTQEIEEQEDLSPHEEGIKEVIENAGNEVTLTLEFIRMQFRAITGKMLTIADASFTDPVQRKAVKDLMRNGLNDHMQWMVEFALNEDASDTTLSGTPLKIKKA